MRLRLPALAILIAPLLAALLWVESPQPAAAEPRQADDAPAVPDGLEVQARGLVHEAYAEPTNTTPAPSAVVEKAPPESVEEAPPEEKPEGDNVVWVPGYWAWDNDAEDFVWISGFWRAAPPGRSWVPGHWQKTADGHQWVAGYWGVAGGLADGQEEVELLPPPPETIDRGPSVPPPAADYHYVPGIWVWRTTRYLWRPGFYVRHRPGWVWVNACYRWTPAGYIFVPSYYDQPLLSRGLLCAPVRFVRPIYLRRGFVYSPVYYVQPDFLLGSLFVSTARRRFYFGNYFEPRYARRFVAWNAYRVGRTNLYDANYSYYRMTYARYPAWERGLAALYAGRFSGDIARPPVTLVQQRKVINNITVNRTTNVVVNKTVNITNIQNVQVVAPLRRKTTVEVTALSSLAGLKPAAAPIRREVKVETMTAARRKEEAQQVDRLRAIARERRAAEAKAAQVAPAALRKEPVKVKVDLPRTVPPPRRVVAKEKPPEAPKRPAVDNTIKPPVVVVPKPKDKEKVVVPPPKPKEKEKLPPPPKPKEKEKAPPPKPKEKEKAKEKAPPPPPPKPKEKAPPPPPKEKEKPPPPPKPKEKEKPPGKNK